MSFSNTAETAINDYIFKGTNVSWDGNTDLWLALHTSDPGEAGSAVTNEAAYGGYARVTMSRASDFTVSGPTVKNTNIKQFPLCTSGSVTCTHISIVTSSSGAGTIIVSGELTNSISVNINIQPQFAAESLSFTLD
jgi:hypothetical protein